jgi:hypothetical protein
MVGGDIYANVPPLPLPPAVVTVIPTDPAALAEVVHCNDVLVTLLTLVQAAPPITTLGVPAPAAVKLLPDIVTV